MISATSSLVETCFWNPTWTGLLNRSNREPVGCRYRWPLKPFLGFEPVKIVELVIQWTQSPITELDESSSLANISHVACNFSLVYDLYSWYDPGEDHETLCKDKRSFCWYSHKTTDSSNFLAPKQQIEPTWCVCSSLRKILRHNLFSFYIIL